MARRDTLVTITTTRQLSFTLSEYRAYFGPIYGKMTRRQMERELREDNGQLAGLYTEMFAEFGKVGGVIIEQTYTVEPIEKESAT